MKRSRRVVGLATILLAASIGVPASASAASGPVKISGSFAFTDPSIPLLFSEQVADLYDLHGFITRDPTWHAPYTSQIIGHATVDAEKMTGSYSIELPIQPEGTLNKVDHSGDAGAGVQVFAANYAPNFTGSPYLEGNDRAFAIGWPTDLASIVTDPENNDEVIGGKVIVWAPDAGENFPSGFGADGLLFTADDPINTIPAGWSVVDLDQSPFKVSTESTPNVKLYEATDVALKDYSKQSYVEAFQSLFDSVSTNWAFNGAPGKHIDWQALYQRAKPKVAAAQAAHDAAAFNAAIAEFINSIPDGHSGIFGDLEDARFTALASAGYAFTMVPLDNGKFTVIFVTPGSPAEKAGIKVGAVITKFNGIPIAKAVAAVVPPLTTSEQSDRTYQQARYLLRAPAGRVASITFTNPGASSKTVKIKAIKERDSLRRSSIFFDAPLPTSPVEFRYLDSGDGYVRINTNFDDLHLIFDEFQYALNQFELNGITDVIVDLRWNSGGVFLGLAGFLTEKTISYGTLEYYSEKTHTFVPQGAPTQVIPLDPQFDFDHIAVLVGPACASACELEAYGFSKLSNTIVVGMHPSSGIEAEVSRGQYLLPEGIGVQIPTGRFVNRDGSLFLEGQGVPLDVQVPVTLANLLSPDDVVLEAAERALARLD
jgi:C-terminal processing protease CtpA/Prc